MPNRPIVSAPGVRGPKVAFLIDPGTSTTGPEFTIHSLANASLAGRGPNFGSRRLAQVSPVVDEATELIPIVARPRPVFVDDTGRRGLLLGWLSVGVALAAVSLIVAFWVSQATSSGDVGPSAACVATAAGDCGVPAGA